MEDILQMMSQIEDDVAKFYEKIYQMKGLQNYEDIFRFMSLHSKHHSETLKSIVSDYKDIPLNKTKYITFVNKLKSNLLSKINETTDRQEISALLEEAEGLLGYAYEQIAKHMDAKAKMMLESTLIKIKKIAEEEYLHKNKVKEIGSKTAPFTANI